jgi:hypothetical protein
VNTNTLLARRRPLRALDAPGAHRDSPAVNTVDVILRCAQDARMTSTRTRKLQPSPLPPLAALPLREPWPVVRVRPDGSYTTLGTLPISLSAVVRWDAAGGLWALDAEQGTVTGYSVGPHGVHEVARDSLEQGFESADLAVAGGHIFVGGAASSGGAYDPQGPLLRYKSALGGGPWSALPVPVEVGKGKAVDALLVDGDRLIAVDDIVMPKWVLVYDLRAPEGPCLLEVIPLEQGVNETTLPGAAMSARWIALRSNGAHMGGSYCAVTLYARGDLSRRGSFGEDRAWDSPKASRFQGASWGGAAFVGETLLVAAGPAGLMTLDCRSLGTLDPDSPVARRRRTDFSRSVRCVVFPGVREVLDVVAVEACGGAFVIVKGASGRRAIWHSCTSG